MTRFNFYTGQLEIIEKATMMPFSILGKLIAGGGTGPEPGPPPLVLDSPTTLSNIDQVGRLISWTAATYSGGVGPYERTLYLKDSETPDGPWSIKKTTTNPSQNYTLQSADVGHYLQATTVVADSEGQELTSLSENVIGPVIAEITVTTEPLASGVAMAGEQVTCRDPVFTGGKNPRIAGYNWLVDDMWVWDSYLQQRTFTLTNAEVGKVVKCQVEIVDDHGYEGLYSVSNGLGPVEPITVSGPNPSLTSLPISPEIYEGMRDTFTTRGSGNGTLTYVWEIRQSNGSWIPATTDNANSAANGRAVFTVFEPATQNEPASSAISIQAAFIGTENPATVRCTLTDNWQGQTATASTQMSCYGAMDGGHKNATPLVEKEPLPTFTGDGLYGTLFECSDLGGTCTGGHEPIKAVIRWLISTDPEKPMDQWSTRSSGPSDDCDSYECNTGQYMGMRIEYSCGGGDTGFPFESVHVYSDRKVLCHY